MEPLAVVSAVVVDCSDPPGVAAFWQSLLGGRIVEYPEHDVGALRAPGITFDFCRNDDQRVTKNRWHLDLATDDADATVERSLSMGATRADDFSASERFVVLRDPEGNEFCVLRGAPASAPWARPLDSKR
jgi:predicted enzyme related to lactoylglutathione lyase